MAPRPLVLLLCAAVSLACGTKAAQSSPSPSARRILLFGLDAGDWAAIDPLVAAGKLPALARIQSAGRKGLLLAEPPLVSPILWTTIATGRPPEEHGVLDFMVDLPTGGQAPVGVASRRVPALWNLFSRNGKSVGVVGWWATSPAEALRGTVVSDRVAPQLARPEGLDPESIAPAAVRARLASLRVRPESLTQADLGAYVPLTGPEFDKAQAALQAGRERLYQDRIAHLATVVAATRTYGAMAEAIVREDQPDLTAVYFESVDTLSHLFVRDPKRGPAALEAAYRDADALLGRLAAAVSPDTWILLCSDHGFYPPDAGISEDPADLTGPATSWHRPYGIVAAAEARVVSGAARAAEARPRIEVGAVSPLDIAPTVLHAAGLPVTTRMRGHVVKGLLPSDAASVPVETASVPDPTPASAPSGTNDAEAVARLRALGYVGAATTSLARVNLGEIYYRSGRLEAAERELRAVLESQPDNLAALLWLAKTLRGRGRNREALAVYQRAARRDEGRCEAIVEAADLAASSGLVADATRLVAETPSTPRNAVSLAVAQAILARAGGDAPLAERKLRSALSRDATAFEALSRLLDLTAGTPRLAGALPLFRRAAALAPASPRHAALLGEALLASGDAAGAEAQLARALALAPDAAPVRLDLARAQLRRGAAERSLATLEEAPPSQERAVLRGASFSALERWPDAAREYRAALALVPQASPELLNGLAWAELKSGRKAEAAALLGRSLAARQDQPEIRRLLAEIGASTRP